MNEVKDNEVKDNEVSTIIPSFKGGICNLTLDELKLSVEQQEFDGSLPKKRPIEHHTFIQELVNIINSFTGLSATIDMLQAPQNGSKRVMWAGEAELCPINNYLFTTVVGKVMITSHANDEMCMALAFTFNDSGIQLGYGVNVSVCMNMTIMNRTHYWTTYGSNDGKTDYELGMDAIRGWLTNLDELWDSSGRMVDRLESITIDITKLHQIYGELIDAAVYKNETGGACNSPLNVTQTVSVIRYITRHMKGKQENHLSAWDLVNAGTSVLKPGATDLKNIIQANASWVNFIIDHLSLNTDNDYIEN